MIKKSDEFLISSRTPYVFKTNGKLVQIGFTENVKTAEYCLTNDLKNLYR